MIINNVFQQFLKVKLLTFSNTLAGQNSVFLMVRGFILFKKISVHLKLKGA